MIVVHNVIEVMQYLDGLKAVIFDLDDTLYSEKEYVKSGYSAVSRVLKQINNVEEKLWQAFSENKNAIDEVLKKEGIYTEELKQQCLHTYRFHKPNIHFYDGVVDMLQKLRQHSFKVGIITDGRPEGQRAKIEVLELDKYVDKIIITDELSGIEYRKPNEKAFVLMKEFLKVEFREICYIGDNITKDFITPMKLGMKFIWINNKDGLYSY